MMDLRKPMTRVYKMLAVLAVPIHEDPAVQVRTTRQLTTMPTRKQVWAAVWQRMMIHNY